jgi:hypothetical protein
MSLIISARVANVLEIKDRVPEETYYNVRPHMIDKESVNLERHLS